MTSDQLSVIAGAVLSLGFSYIPGLNTWFAGLSPEKKRLIMLGILALIALSIFGLACTPLAANFGITVTCDVTGASALIQAFLLAVIGNQSAYLITPQSAGVRAVKTSRGLSSK
jgi:hypothetical protein